MPELEDEFTPQTLGGVDQEPQEEPEAEEVSSDYQPDSVEETQEPEAVDEAQEGGFSPQVVAYAQGIGLSEEDLAGFSDEESFIAALTLAQRFANSGSQGDGERKPVPGTQSDQVSESPDEVKWDDLDIDEDVASRLQQAFKSKDSKISSLESKLNTIEGFLAQQSQAAFTQYFDNVLDQMNSDALGKSGSLTKSQLNARRSTYEKLSLMQQAAPERSIEELIELAAGVSTKPTNPVVRKRSASRQGASKTPSKGETAAERIERLCREIDKQTFSEL